MRRLLAGVFILAVPASAQNTNCQLYGNSVNCQTTQLPPGIDWNLARPAKEPETDSLRTSERGPPNYARRAGALVADGRCDEAKALALRMGDFQLARDVASVCTK